tara:strand:+ start:730 stop:906 length:177 start_codon:yes stop_codon:yes gene_type:complete
MIQMTETLYGWLSNKKEPSSEAKIRHECLELAPFEDPMCDITNTLTNYVFFGIIGGVL